MPSKPKLTPWFPGGVKPARVGIYEREWPDLIGPFYARWDGFYWGLSRKTVDEAIGAIDHWEIAHPDRRWRGLASNPAA